MSKNNQNKIQVAEKAKQGIGFIGNGYKALFSLMRGDYDTAYTLTHKNKQPNKTLNKTPNINPHQAPTSPPSLVLICCKCNNKMTLSNGLFSCSKCKALIMATEEF